MRRLENQRICATALPHWNCVAGRRPVARFSARMGTNHRHRWTRRQRSAHAAVRRWTAYTRDTVKLSSEAIHDVDQGDGIRCFIISSRHGILKSATLKNSKQLMEIDSIVVEPGDTIDFVVDYNANLNNDQFLWSPLIKGTQAIAAGSSRDSAVDLWNAQVDFTGPLHIYLSPEEQLARFFYSQTKSCLLINHLQNQPRVALYNDSPATTTAKPQDAL